MSRWDAYAANWSDWVYLETQCFGSAQTTVLPVSIPLVMSVQPVDFPDTSWTFLRRYQ